MYVYIALLRKLFSTSRAPIAVLHSLVNFKWCDILKLSYLTTSRAPVAVLSVPPVEFGERERDTHSETRDDSTGGASRRGFGAFLKYGFEAFLKNGLRAYPSPVDTSALEPPA